MPWINPPLFYDGQYISAEAWNNNIYHNMRDLRERLLFAAGRIRSARARSGGEVSAGLYFVWQAVALQAEDFNPGVYEITNGQMILSQGFYTILWRQDLTNYDDIGDAETRLVNLATGAISNSAVGGTSAMLVYANPKATIELQARTREDWYPEVRMDVTRYTA